MFENLHRWKWWYTDKADKKVISMVQTIDVKNKIIYKRYQLLLNLWYMWLIQAEVLVLSVGIKFLTYIYLHLTFIYYQFKSESHNLVTDS